VDRNAPAAPGKEQVGLFQQNRTRSSGTKSAQTASPGSWTFTLSGRHGGATESMDSELTELGLMQKGQWSSRRPCRTTCMATDWLKTLERVSKRFHRYYQLGRWNDEHRHRVRRQRCVLSFWFAHLHRSRTGQRDRRSTNSTGRLSQKRSVASVHKIQAGGSSQGSATYVPPRQDLPEFLISAA
jgi:hypothetical protein